MPTVLGLDIGYSNLKLAWGSAGKPNTLVLPAGAGRIDELAMGVDLKADLGDGAVITMPSGDRFVAGLPHRRFGSKNRELSDYYPASPEYMALFLAALAKTGERAIDLVVTGLPVSEYRDKAKRDRLAERLTGTHFLGGEYAVKVRAVRVIPQPLGAYFAATQERTELARDQDLRVLVGDPGYFSWDFVLLDGGGLRESSSGSSLEATSRILERAARSIAQATSNRVSAERLEDCLREGRETLQVGVQTIDITGYIEAAAAEAAQEVLKEIKASLRLERDSIDAVVVAGGGATLYHKALKEALPRAHVFMVKDPVLANARGFWTYGQFLLQQSQSGKAVA